MLIKAPGRSKEVVGHQKIAVVIATFNAAATLQNCLNSIFNQSCQNIEVIVIDGQSTDNTVDILRNNPKIAFWKSEPDKGVYDAMNKALSYITVEWVYFIGADDELLPGFSTMAVELTDPKVIYYGNVFAEGSKRLGELTRYQFAKFGPYHQAMIYPKAVFEKYKFDINYTISADFALTLTLCGDQDFRFAYRDHVIANFNHTGLSAVQIDTAFQKDKARLIFKSFGLKTWIRYILHRYKHKANARA